MNIDNGQITIKDVRHVMKLLVGSLYGHDPHLTIRELVQNAHDAMVDLPQSVPLADRIITLRLFMTGQRPYLEVQDTGVGMSGPEMRENFGKIGDSSKLARAIDHPELIGRFGIGFLSAFIIADHVEVLSRKHASSGLPAEDTGNWLWVTKDQQNWTLTKLDDQASSHWTLGTEFRNGTRVRLYFRDRYEGTNAERITDIKTLDGLEKIIQTNCYLLRYAIKVAARDEGGRVANLVREPWSSDALADEAFKALFGKNPPYFTHRFERDDPNSSYSAKGILYFREQLNRTPSVQLYVKRMLVNAEDRLLIPPYGIFASGIVECPALEVDLSRRQVAAFDPAYKWLRTTMLREFETAFLEMTKRRMEQFVGIWPSIDNSFIVHLMEAHRSENDETLKWAAHSMLRNCGTKLPFYQVDLISGSQGRPVWQTMEEFADKRRRELTPEQLRNGSSLAENPVDEAGRIRVYFTRSQQPQEKDLLIEKYKELFDVGRAEKAHELVFGALLKMGSEVPQLALCEVQASRFGQVEDAAEVGRWQHLRDQLQRGLVFQGRGHEVAIEHFDPKTTPIIITDSKVDSEQVRQLREQLAGLASMGGLGDKLIEFLGNLEKRGGSLIIHVNARNEMMVRLRDSLMASQSEVRNSAAEGLSLIAWRAVIDYFGWTSSRDMMARDRENAHLIIRNLLAASTESSALRSQIEEWQAKYDESLTEKSKLEQQIAQGTHGDSEPRTVKALCGFVDFVDSTQKLMTNSKVTPEDRWKLFRLLTDELVGQIDSFGGETIVFTGDGVLFIVEKRKESVHDVGAALEALSGSMKVVLGRPGVAREILSEMGEAVPSLRIGISYGKFSLGRIGPTINAVGLPIVEAARIANDNDLMRENKTNLLVSRTAVDYGAQNGMWQATAFREAGVHEGQGLPVGIKVYMLKSDR